MGGVFVLYLLGTGLSYPKIKAKSCLSCERFVNSGNPLRLASGQPPPPLKWEASYAPTNRDRNLAPTLGGSWHLRSK